MMFAWHTLHGLRILKSCALEFRRRYPSSQTSWPYEGQSMQLTLPFVLRVGETGVASAVSERPGRNHSSAFAVSHSRRDTPNHTTCSNDMVTELLMATNSNVCPTLRPCTRWSYIAWVYVTRGSHNCVSRGMTELPSLQRKSTRDSNFLESLRICRECVPQGKNGIGGGYKDNVPR